MNSGLAPYALAVSVLALLISLAVFVRDWNRNRPRLHFAIRPGLVSRGLGRGFTSSTEVALTNRSFRPLTVQHIGLRTWESDWVSSSLIPESDTEPPPKYPFVIEPAATVTVHMHIAEENVTGAWCLDGMGRTQQFRRYRLLTLPNWVRELPSSTGRKLRQPIDQRIQRREEARRARWAKLDK